jgi:hypothetical protein
MQIPDTTIQEAQRRATDEIEQAKKAWRKASTLQEHKEAATKEVKGRRIKNARKPVSYNGNKFGAGPESQQKLTGKLTYAQTTGKDTDSSWSVGWKTANNNYVQLSYDDLSAVVGAVNEQIQAAYDNEARLLSEINQAETTGELEAINLMGGWS